MNNFILLVLVGLEIKHFLADYALQTGWMIRGKSSLFHAGGYIHAAIHVAGTAFILLIAALPLGLIIWLVIAEFVVHFVLDFGKARISKNISSTNRPHLFWTLNGLDQLMHHLTYIAIIFVIAA